MADYLPPVVAKLTGDDASLTRTLAGAKDKVKRWAIEVGKTKVTLTLDAKLRDGALAEVRRRVEASPAAKLKVDLQLGTGQREALRRSLEDREVQVKVKPVMDQAALRRVQTVLMELGRRIDVQVRPQIDGRTQRRAEATLTRLSRDRTATIRTRVVGGGTPSSTGSSAAEDTKALATLISLAPALTPIAATLTTVAMQAGAAGLAVGTFGLAVKSQLSGIGAAADAQDKYNQAVAKYGQYSKQAQAAQEASARSLDGMPAATQRATEGWLHLKDTFKAWSDSQAKFTMQPVLHSFAVAEQILPRLTPMVKGTSTELDRLVTIAGGAVETPGFDRFMKRLGDFSTGVLKNATDDVIHFARVLSEGSSGDSGVAKFLAYAKAEGPLVRETLINISKAVETIIKGSAEAGPGMLTLVNAVAKLVASLPPAFVGRVMQAYAAFRLFKLANVGISAVTTAVESLSTRLVALRAASAAAGGGVRGVGAAVGTLSTGAKVAGAVGVVVGLAYAAYKLADSNKQARISVDDLARSIQTGLSKGRIQSPVIDELRDGLAGVLKETDASASAWDKIGYSFTHWGSKWSSSASSAKAVANAQRDLGKAIGEVAQNQGVDKATQALALLNKEGARVPTKYLKDYNNALADQQFQDQMAANSMGLFGNQAQQVQKKLDAQKQAVQGLQQAILDLNDTNRAALDAESAYQQSIDDATAMIKHHTTALKYNNGALDLGNQKAREAYGVLSQMAASAEAASTAVLQQTGSQDKANRVLIDAHQHLMDAAHAMGLSTADAKRLADQLDSIKDPKIQVTANIMDLQAKAKTVENRINALARMRPTPKVNAEIRSAQQQLSKLNAQINALNKTVHVTLKVGTAGMPKDVKNLYGFGAATGAIMAGGVRKMAQGGFGRPAMMAKGGSNILWGEGPDESYIPHTRNARSRQIASETVGILGGSVSWGHDAVAAGGHVASGLALGMSGGSKGVESAATAMARAAIGAFSTEMGIASPSKKFRALGAYVISGLVQGLTGSTASVKAATRRIASTLYVDFGSSHKSLQKWVAKENAALLKLAAQRDSTASKLKTAQTNLTNLQKQWTSERDSVAQGIMQNASIVTASPDASRGVNANDVVAQMQQRVKAAQQFAAELDQLRKKGLRSDLIAQLASAGVDQAGDTALALSAGSSSQIKQMNQLQGSLQTAANNTGTAVADSMYGAGIQSAKGLVKGLQSQEKAIEAQMLKIAKSMQGAIKKALGIKSPSTVMAELGDYTAKGMALGIQRSTKHAVIAARGMAMSVQHGATITGPTGGGYRGGDLHVHVHVSGSVTSERNLIEAVRTGIAKDGLRNNNIGLTPRR